MLHFDKMEKKAQEYVTEYQEKAEYCGKYQQRYMYLWYGLGYPQIVCSSLLTYLTSPDGFSWGLVVGLISVLLSVSLVFFDIRAKVEKFKETKLQYFDLAQDIEEALLRPDNEELHELLNDSLEKEKFIIAYAISPSQCLECG